MTDLLYESSAVIKWKNVSRIDGEIGENTMLKLCSWLTETTHKNCILGTSLNKFSLPLSIRKVKEMKYGSDESN